MNTVDMLVHVHPKLDARARADLERKLMGHAGIGCAQFSDKANLQALVVTYDSDTVERKEILEEVRTLDPEAMTLGC